VPSGHPGRADFPAGQVSFHSNLPNGQGIRQNVRQLHKKSKLRLSQGKKNLRATCPKGKMDFKLSSTPGFPYKRRSGFESKSKNLVLLWLNSKR